MGLNADFANRLPFATLSTIHAPCVRFGVYELRSMANLIIPRADNRYLPQLAKLDVISDLCTINPRHDVSPLRVWVEIRPTYQRFVKSPKSSAGHSFTRARPHKQTGHTRRTTRQGATRSHCLPFRPTLAAAEATMWGNGSGEDSYLVR